MAIPVSRSTGINCAPPRRDRLPQNLTQAQRDLVGAHTFERVAEQVELTVCAGIVGALGFGQRNQSRGETADQTQTDQCKLIHVPFAFPTAGRRFNFNHGAGFWP